MTKTFHIISFLACLQLPGQKSGCPAVKYELSGTNRIYAGAEILPKTARNSSYAAAGSKPVAQADTVHDIDGHVYHVVKIGRQRWLQENLKTAHFSDGSAITEMEYAIDWSGTFNTGNPAWCCYERIEQNNNIFGKLYNWYTVSDRRNVCPTGWHVPSDEEFQLLSDTLGGDDVSGAHLKAIKLWDEKDEKYANNSSGFSALPAGMRYRNGSFDRVGADGTDFWSSSDYRIGSALCRSLYYEGSNLGRHYLDRRSGLSVRCVAN